MLQNESVDEDLEHFEDAVEETDTEPSDASKKQENDVKLVDGTDDAKPDSQSSDDEDDIPASDSEEDVSDESQELIFKGNSEDLQKSETLHRDGPQHPQSSKSLLLGGYNPRHREPSYWYFSIQKSPLVLLCSM